MKSAYTKGIVDLDVCLTWEINHLIFANAVIKQWVWK